MTQRKFGWKPSLPSKAGKFAAFPEKQSLSLPALVDLEKGFSPIEDQGAHGTCVGHGVCAVLEYLELWELRQKLSDDQAPEVFDPSFEDISRLFIYKNAQIIDGQPLFLDQGTSIASAIKGIKTKGICRESLWPYADELVPIKPGPKAYAEAAQHKIIWDYKIDNTNINQMKQCLAWSYPIVFGITCYDSMMTQSVEKSGHIPLPSELDSPVGGHCMVLMGYDDLKKQFKIRNSWGKNWGNGGYGTMDYAYLTDPDLASDFWTLRKNSPIT